MPTNDHARDKRATKPRSLAAAVLLVLITCTSHTGICRAQEASTSESEADVNTEANQEQGEASQARRIAMLSQTEREEQAQNLYAAGEQAFFDREYDQAVAMWRRAFELSGHPGLVYNMGTAEMHRGDRERAINLYREFLVMAPDTPAREAVEARIAEMAAILERPPTVVQPGLFEGRFWTWIALGTAGATGATALGFWAGAQNRRDELAASCGQTVNGCTGAQIADVTDRISYTNMALSFSVAATIAAVAFYFFERPEDRVLEPEPPLPDPIESNPEEETDSAGETEGES